MMESNEVERLKNDSYSTGFCQQPSDKDQGITLAFAFVVFFIVVNFFIYFLIKKNSGEKFLPFLTFRCAATWAKVTLLIKMGKMTDEGKEILS